MFSVRPPEVEKKNVVAISPPWVTTSLDVARIAALVEDRSPYTPR